MIRKAIIILLTLFIGGQSVPARLDPPIHRSLGSGSRSQPTLSCCSVSCLARDPVLPA